MFGGITNALIPLYAVGVFTVVHAVAVGHGACTTARSASPAGGAASCINAVGAVATCIVLLIVVVSKFTEGAWMPIVVIPLIVLLFKSIKRHYSTRVEASR